MPIDYCYEPGTDTPVPCSTEELGAQYYEAVQSGDPNALTSWYQTHLENFMGQLENYPYEEGADFDINNPEHFNAWMGTYGQYYAPLSADQADFDRISRESSLQKERLGLEFMEKQPGRELEQGKRGFANIGSGASPIDTDWDEYSANYQNILTQSATDMQNLYGQFGSDWLMMTSSIAGLEGFTDDAVFTDWNWDEDAAGFSWLESFYSGYADYLDDPSAYDFELGELNPYMTSWGWESEGQYWAEVLGMDSQEEFTEWMQGLYGFDGDVNIIGEEGDEDYEVQNWSPTGPGAFGDWAWDYDPSGIQSEWVSGSGTEYWSSIENCLQTCYGAMGEEGYQQCASACMD